MKGDEFMRKIFVKNNSGYEIEFNSVCDEILDANDGKSVFKPKEIFVLLEPECAEDPHLDYPEIIVYNEEECNSYYSNGYKDNDGNRHIEFYIENL